MAYLKFALISHFWFKVNKSQLTYQHSSKNFFIKDYLKTRNFKQFEEVLTIICVIVFSTRINIGK